jgi:hypothetical protein
MADTDDDRNKVPVVVEPERALDTVADHEPRRIIGELVALYQSFPEGWQDDNDRCVAVIEQAHQYLTGRASEEQIANAVMVLTTGCKWPSTIVVEPEHFLVRLHSALTTKGYPVAVLYAAVWSLTAQSLWMPSEEEIVAACEAVREAALNAIALIEAPEAKRYPIAYLLEMEVADKSEKAAMVRELRKEIEAQHAAAAAQESLQRHFDDNLALPERDEMASYHHLSLRHRSDLDYFVTIIRDPIKQEYLPLIRQLEGTERAYALEDCARYSGKRLINAMSEYRRER